MIKFNELNPVQLESRLGRVGSVQSFDLWKFRESRESMIEGVAQIASLSYGNEAAKNPQQLFDRIISLGHLSCLEFVPIAFSGSSLPFSSFRTVPADDWKFGAKDFKWVSDYDATGFLVECPVFVARQWMRHRSFSYLEMSRRYVKDSKVPVEFYGDEKLYINELAVDTYDLLITSGEPPELARRVLPVGMMTKFYVGGFNRDWKKFCDLRSDPHAQAEIRVFSDYIKGVIDACK